MEEMNDNLKKLRKSIKNASENAASLETLSKMQHATVAAKVLVPARAAKVPEADRAKFLAGYRKDMAALLEHLCKIEVALLDNDNAKAEELFKGLKKVEDDGHEKYSEE
jgi:soluble cytochrome b562